MVGLAIQFGEGGVEFFDLDELIRVDVAEILARV
jgi:hypothetical protein